MANASLSPPSLPMGQHLQALLLTKKINYGRHISPLLEIYEASQNLF